MAQEFNEHAKEYREIFNNWMELDELRQAMPENAGILEESFVTAEQTMLALEPNAAASFQAAIAPQESDDIKLKREGIENIRETAPFKKGLISESQVQEMLAQLPSAEPFSEDDHKFASAFFVGKAVGAVVRTPGFWLNFPSVPGNSSTEAADQAGNPANPETDGRTPLHIKLYRGNNVMVFNPGQKNCQIEPLARRKNIASHDAVTELFIEDLRFRAIEFLAARPATEGEEWILPSKIWEAIMPTARDGSQIKYNSSAWYQYIGDYLSELAVDGVQLIENYKPGPESKRRYYRFGSFAAEFEYTDEAMDGIAEGMFKLPNGIVIGGRSGIVMHGLLGATEEHPLNDEDLIKFGLYTKEELAQDKSLLSNCLSTVRSALRHAEAESFYTIHARRFGEKRPGKGTQRPMAYWMTPNEEPDPGQPEQADPAPEPTAFEAFVIREKEDSHRTEHIHEAGLVATHLAMLSDALGKMSLPRLDTTVAENLALADSLNGLADSADPDAIWKAYEKLRDVIKDPQAAEGLFDMIDGADSRWGLLDYMDGILRDKFDELKLEKVLEEHLSQMRAPVPAQPRPTAPPAEPAPAQEPVIDERPVEGPTDSDPGNSVSETDDEPEADTEPVEARPVSIPLQDLAKAGGANRGPKSRSRGRGQAAANETRPGKRAQGRETVLKELEKTAVPRINEALDTMLARGMFKEGGVTMRQITDAFPNMNSGKMRAILGSKLVPVNGLHVYQPEHVLKAYLAIVGDDGNRFQRAMNINFQRRGVEEVIDRELQKFREKVLSKQGNGNGQHAEGK